MPEAASSGASEEEQLRELLERIIHNEEKDNRRLALDLHDGLVQLMVAAFQHLQAAQAWQQRDPSAEQKELTQGMNLLRQAINEARHLINELRPAGLDEFGFVQALKLYIAQVATDTGWDISLDISPNWPRLPADLETTLFRIVQEAMTNARKYSLTNRMAIHLTADNMLHIEIRDWGRGFIPEQVQPDQAGIHIGLVGIRERARLWGGSCLIESVPGQGTVIRLEFPNQAQEL